MQDLLRPRIEHLKAAAGQQQAEPAEAEAEPVAADLDPADPWALKVEELASDEEAWAALSELTAMLSAGEIAADHFGRVEEADPGALPESRPGSRGRVMASRLSPAQHAAAVARRREGRPTRPP